MQAPLIQPFTAIRPAAGRAQEVAARPYDVVTTDEASALAAGRAWSFFHVSRAEIDAPPGTAPDAPEVYSLAARAFARMQEQGVLVRDPEPHYYGYRMTQDGHVQLGLAAAASVTAYRENRVRRHEHTRPAKEDDRVRQIEAVGAHTGPVLVAHRPDAVVAEILAQVADAPPDAEATIDDGTCHQVWVITERDATEAITRAFEAMPAVYIADGHHRSAAGARVAERRGEQPGRFLIVSFPSDSVRILDYNRVVKDLNGLSVDEFLAAVAAQCIVEPAAAPVRPDRRGCFGMLVGDRWYALTLRASSGPLASAVARLDVSQLNERLLAPVLGIGDPRTDSRIDFIGGSRGLDGLAARVRDGWAVAFAMYPTMLEDLMAVADAGDVMPPKSTWFEPKLADGMLSLPVGGSARAE